MTIQRRDVPAIEVSDVPKGAGRTQVAALCWRMQKGKPEVLLVTSRETGRWVIPKGWPMKDRSDPEAAQREAWEEAGVKGQVGDHSLGVYAYHKVLGSGSDVPCVVSVFPMQVDAVEDKFPEAAERERRWFAPKKAARRVDEPELRDILRGFDPDALNR